MAKRSDILLGGVTASTNFPTQSPFQNASGGSDDIIVLKLNPAGTALIYSTYLGGSGQDIGRGIAVDAAGSAYVTGSTSSTAITNFAPSGSFQTVKCTSSPGAASNGTVFHTSVLLPLRV